MSTKSRMMAGKNTGLVDNGIRHKVGENIRWAMGQIGLSGATVAVVTPGGREVIVEGRISPHGQLLEGNELYDIGSITKAFLAFLFHILLGKNGLDGVKLDSQVSNHLPLDGPSAEALLVKHLLWFLVEFEAGESLSSMVANGIDPTEIILQKGLAAAPGNKFNYCNHSSVVLGLLIEKLTRRSLPVLMRNHIFKPLGMSETTFHPEQLEDSRLARFVPTENGLRGVVHDESARLLLSQKDKAIGSAGLFSTAPDILKFLAMLLDGGLSPLSEKMVPKATMNRLGVNQIPGKGLGFGHGLGLYSVFCNGLGSDAVSSPKSVFKGSFTGAQIVFLPHEHLGFFIGTDFLAGGRRSKGALHRWMAKVVGDVVKIMRQHNKQHHS